MAKTQDFLSYLDDRITIAPANTQEEYLAAQTIAEVMTAHGVDVAVEEFDSPALGGIPQGLLQVLVFIGALLSGTGQNWSLPVGILLVLIGAVPLLLEASGYSVVRKLSGKAVSQNVVGFHEATGPAVIKGARPIVIVAHYDTPHESFLYGSQLSRYLALVRTYRLLLVRVVVAALIVQLLVFLPDAVRTVAWILGIVAALPLLLLGVGSVAEQLSPCTPGMNDNKSSVAAMLGVLADVHPSDWVPEITGRRAKAEAEAAAAAAAAQAEAAAAALEAAAQAIPPEEEVVGVRHGQHVIEELGLLPRTCEIEYVTSTLDPIPLTETDLVGYYDDEYDHVDEKFDELVDQYADDIFDEAATEAEPEPEVEPEAEPEAAEEPGVEAEAQTEPEEEGLKLELDIDIDLDSEPEPETEAEAVPVTEYVPEDDPGISFAVAPYTRDEPESKFVSFFEKASGFFQGIASKVSSAVAGAGESLNNAGAALDGTPKSGEMPTPASVGAFSYGFDPDAELIPIPEGGLDDLLGDEADELLGDETDSMEPLDLEFDVEVESDEAETLIDDLFEEVAAAAEDAEETVEAAIDPEAEAEIEAEVEAELTAIKEAIEEETAEAEAAAEDAAEDVVEAVEEAVEEAEDIAEGVAEEATEAIEELVDETEDAIEEAPEAIEELAEEAVDEVAEIAEETEEAAEESVEEAAEVTEDLVEDVEEAVNEAADVVEDAEEFVEDAAEELDDAVEETVDEVEDVIEDETEEIEEAAEELADEAEEAAEELADEAEEAAEEAAEIIDDVVDEAEEAAEAAAEAVEELADEAEEAAEAAAEAVDDVVEEVEEAVEEATETVDELVDEVEEAVEDVAEEAEEVIEEAVEEVVDEADDEEPLDAEYEPVFDADAYTSDESAESEGFGSRLSSAFRGFVNRAKAAFMGEETAEAPVAEPEPVVEPVEETPDFTPAIEELDDTLAAELSIDAEPEVGDVTESAPKLELDFEFEPNPEPEVEDTAPLSLIETEEPEVAPDEVEATPVVDRLAALRLVPSLDEDGATVAMTREELLRDNRFALDLVEGGNDDASQDSAGLYNIGDSLDLTADAPANPEPVDDPTWGQSTYNPPKIDIARRASLFDLPDPSENENDPFAFGANNRPANQKRLDENNGWKGGAALRSDLRDEEAYEDEFAFEDEDAEVFGVPAEEEMREAILSLGDDELIAHDIWFVALGASGMDNAGMRAFLDEHRRDIRGAFLVNLDCVGAGELTLLTEEGEGKARHCDRRISRLLKTIASDLHTSLKEMAHRWGDTDATPAMRKSVRSITIMGCDESGLPAYSRQPQDDLDKIDPKQIALVNDLVSELIRRS